MNPVKGDSVLTPIGTGTVAQVYPEQSLCDVKLDGNGTRFRFFFSEVKVLERSEEPHATS